MWWGHNPRDLRVTVAPRARDSILCLQLWKHKPVFSQQSLSFPVERGIPRQELAPGATMGFFPYDRALCGLFQRSVLLLVRAA